jgi:hypothetical protein
MPASDADKPSFSILESDLDEMIEEITKSKPLSDNEIELFYSEGTFRIVYQTNNFFLPQIKTLIDGTQE